MGLLDFLKKKHPGDYTNTSGKNFRNEIEKEMYINNIAGYRSLKNQLNHQDDLLIIANEARERYKTDGDIETAIAAYEKVLLEADPPLVSTAHTMFLADLYIKAEMFDKAWGYLNSLIGTDRAPLDKIRHEQARILKKEKRHQEAIEMILLEYLAKSEWNNTFSREACLKCIGPSIRALKWSSDDQDRCADLVEAQVTKRRYNENTLIKNYRALVSNMK